jgi:ankyrin repeat protein
VIVPADRFRWAYCQLEILRRTLPAHLRRALKNMPKTLDETYERALLEIDEEMRQYAQRLFQCLTVSIRPLRVEELAEILAVQFDAGEFPEFNPDWRFGDAEEAVLSVCSNLISVVDVGGSQVVQFSHFSVKEFLTSDRLAAAREGLSGYYIVPHSAHTVIAQASLSVLLQLNDSIDKDSIKDFPLSGYAAQYWVDHGQFENVSSTIQVAMEHLFNRDKLHFSAWVWIYDIDNPWRANMRTMHPNRPTATPLYYAVLCGFHGLIEHLVSTYPKDMDTKGGYYRSPLLAAFVKDDIGTASSLLQRGADVNVLDKLGLSPLHQASQGGRLDIVQLLLEHGADINLQSSTGVHPLGVASRAGKIEVVRLLLKRGANVNSQNKSGRSALYSAARCGHLNVVRLLIESGANVDLHNKQGSTPLYFASNRGHVKLAELLIQHGANVGLRKNSGRTPLHAAASQAGRVQLAELLIQSGAHVDSRDNEDRTPMHLAAFNGKLDIVKLLVGGGADPNIHDDDNKTPLDLAEDNEKLDVANFLSPLTTFLVEEVESTASSVSSSASSPASSSSWHSSVVELPEPRIEDVEPSKDQQSSIHTASRNGQLDVVRSLLDHGSDVDERDHIGRTALIVASRDGKLQVAKLLIERGAYVNSRSNAGWTPLHHASINGHLDVVRLLLNHCADLNARMRSQKTALACASSKGHLEIAKLLLERGANANGRNGFGLTPKHQAIAGGHGKVAELLSQYGA